jgi:prevent-host-death family protein
MKKKSDNLRSARVTATEASRSFSKILDRVEKGRRFVVHRRGKDVCVISPPPVRGRRASECLEILRGRAPVLLDRGFGEDLLGWLGQEPAEGGPSWGS